MTSHWKISKDFYCDYGHRVWTQKLKEEFCAVGDTSCKCKHLHGHTGKITVELEANHLEAGFVTDFKHLGFVKDFVDKYFDHRFIIDRNDPLFESMTSSFEHSHELLRIPEKIGLWRFQSRKQTIDVSVPGEDKFPYSPPEMDIEQVEYIESFTVVNFVPTSENLCRFIYEYVQERIGNLAKVSSVVWQETPKSKAVYSKN